MRAAYDRTKAAAKLRRQIARGEHGMMAGMGSGGGLNSAAVAALAAERELQQKEYFAGDRFQQLDAQHMHRLVPYRLAGPAGGGRSSTGEWRSRYRLSDGSDVFDWRMENKMRTVACALCMCLNIGVDPPGVDRPTPCASLECWIDPLALQPPAKSLELIGATLQSQYARLQPKAKFEMLLDPTSGSVKRTIQSLRRSAKHERILFHYNGHGVPRPTTNGELWVFDRSYTLYVPLSVDDLLAWMAGPAIIVLDCAGSGALVERFSQVLKQKAEESAKMLSSDPERGALLPDYSECILLGATGATQALPLSNPSLPLDIFTACLTTPLKIALKYFAETSFFGRAGSSFASSSSSSAGGGAERVTLDSFLDRASGQELLDLIPGKVSERKTPLGELQWIYTAVTDTIAWNILPQTLFQKLFRQDQLLASLLRNFLLATRVLAGLGATTVSVPALPHANLIAKHPMWASWDLCLEQYCLSLEKMLLGAREQASRMAAAAARTTSTTAGASVSPAATPGAGVGPVGVGIAPTAAAAAQATAAALAAHALAPPRFSREHITFFSDHLTAFEVYLEVGLESSGPPIQLPIVLQVLLSQVHRRRALVLLARFLGKGTWAVNQALAVGIFPYVLKLLQSPDLPLREVLIFIWSKLLALDRTCQRDLIREGHERYFLTHLASPAPSAASTQQQQPGPHLVTERQRVMSAFVLSALCDSHPAGQMATLRAGGLQVFASHLDSESPSLRKWMCLCMGKLWEGHEEAKVAAIAAGLPEKLCGVIADPVPEVRAAALYALGTFMNSSAVASLSPVASSTAASLLDPFPPPPPQPAAATTPPFGSASTSPPVPSTRERQSIELMLAKNFSQLVVDASPLVREELVIALAHLVDAQKSEFTVLAHERMHGDADGTGAQPNSASVGGGGGGGGSVPASPMQHGLSSPGMYASAFVSNNHAHSASTGNLASLANGPPTHHRQSSTGMGVLSLAGAATSSPGLMSSASSGSFARVQHSEPLRSPSPPAQGLAIALSPSMLAASAASTGRVITPLSPLQLHGSSATAAAAANNTLSVSGASGWQGPASPSRSGSVLGSTPASASAVPSAGQTQQRGSITRVSSSGALSAFSNPQDAALYQQRLLIWRVVRTLSHDPYPGVATVAITLRKIVVARGYSSNLLHSSSANSPPNGAANVTSSGVGTPVLQSALSALNTVPEQSLDSANGEYDVSEPVSAANFAERYGAGAAGAGPSRTRGRSDSTGASGFDQIMTRPRGRDVDAPPPHPGHGQAAGVLSAAHSGGSNARAPSPTPMPRAMSTFSSSPSPASSPLHHPMAAPGSVMASSSLGARRSMQVSSVSSAQNRSLLASFNEDPLSSAAYASAPFLHLLPPSTIYARSAEYFVAPVGAVSPAGNHPSTHEAHESPDRVLEKMLTEEWRRKHNHSVVTRACSLRQDLYDVHERGGFEQVAALSTGFESVSTLLFHPFEPLLLIGEKRQLSVWDTRGESSSGGGGGFSGPMERLSLFSNENARGTKISNIQWINEWSQSLLLAGSDDGVVRLWKGVHERERAPEIVSAWVAVRSMPRGSGVGLVLDWQQETGHLLAAGPVDSIRVWDVEREICVLDLPVDSEGSSYVSSVCSMAEGGVVFAGCGDGCVRMFDLRADNHTIHTVSRHGGSVVHVRVQRQGLGWDGDLLSGGVTGDIHLSDTRMLGSGAANGTGAHGLPLPSSASSLSASALHGSVVRSMAAFDKQGLPLDALAVHEHAPLFAAGSRKQVVRVADFKSSPGGPGTVGSIPGAGTSTTTVPMMTTAQTPQQQLQQQGGGTGSGPASPGSTISASSTLLGGSSPSSSLAPSPPQPTGATVSTLKYFKGFLSARLAPVCSVVFHPHELMLATGGLGPLVQVSAAVPATQRA